MFAFLSGYVTTQTHVSKKNDDIIILMVIGCWLNWATGYLTARPLQRLWRTAKKDINWVSVCAVAVFYNNRCIRHSKPSALWLSWTHHPEGTRASVPPPVSSLRQSDYSTLTWAEYLTLHDSKTLHTCTLPSCIRHGFIYKGNSFCCQCCCCTYCSCTTQQLTAYSRCPVYFLCSVLIASTNKVVLSVCQFSMQLGGPVSNEPKKILFNFGVDPSDS